jgi:hypothetical protein
MAITIVDAEFGAAWTGEEWLTFRRAGTTDVVSYAGAWVYNDTYVYCHTYEGKNDGIRAALIYEVTETRNGVTGTPVPYSVVSGFEWNGTTYPDYGTNISGYLTLSKQNLDNRANAWAAYVANQVGAQITTTGVPTMTDTGKCPLPEPPPPTKNIITFVTSTANPSLPPYQAGWTLQNNNKGNNNASNVSMDYGLVKVSNTVGDNGLVLPAANKYIQNNNSPLSGLLSGGRGIISASPGVGNQLANYSDTTYNNTASASITFNDYDTYKVVPYLLIKINSIVGGTLMFGITMLNIKSPSGNDLAGNNAVIAVAAGEVPCYLLIVPPVGYQITDADKAVTGTNQQFSFQGTITIN